MPNSYAFFGGELNGGPINGCAINNILYAKYTVDTGGYSSSSGSANAYGEYHYYPSGGSVTSGIVTEAYGQLAVVGGNSTTYPFTLDAAWAHAYYPSGWSVSSGSADAYGVIQVQVMHTERTTVVQGYGTEVAIPSLDNLAVVLSTEDREAIVPYTPSFYEVD